MEMQPSVRTLFVLCDSPETTLWRVHPGKKWARRPFGEYFEGDVQLERQTKENMFVDSCDGKMYSLTWEVRENRKIYVINSYARDSYSPFFCNNVLSKHIFIYHYEIINLVIFFTFYTRYFIYL